MSEELKPCPFCQSQNIIVQSTGSLQYRYCKNCSARGPLFYKAAKDGRPSWNHRPIEDALRADLARKDALIAALYKVVGALERFDMLYPEDSTEALNMVTPSTRRKRKSS